MQLQKTDMRGMGIPLGRDETLKMIAGKGSVEGIPSTTIG
jgi:hypothetical protein